MQILLNISLGWSALSLVCFAIIQTFDLEQKLTDLKKHSDRGLS